MADWTNTRLNLRYHWKTALLWGLVIGGILAGIQVGRAGAWTRGVGQPYPDGEAPVVVHGFCRSSRGCGSLSQADWRAAIRHAMSTWNAAGSPFRFIERRADTTADPCRLSGAVVVMAFRTGLGCSQDQVVFDDIERRGRDWHGLAILWPDGPHVYVKEAYLFNLRALLLHEFGHIVGLGHPDELGQNVEAVMNLRNTYDTLQPDDIAGIQALYGVEAVTPPEPEPEPSAGFLGSPAQDTTVSGISFVSGWKCNAQDITVRIDGGPALEMSMGVLRTDTSPHCDGEAHNGFITQVNWNSIGAGTHTAVAYDNGVEFDRNTFTVGTTGEEFLRGVVVDIDVSDFPTPGRTSRFVWNEGTQHLELAEVYAQPPPAPDTTGDLSQFAFLIDDEEWLWEFDITTATDNLIWGSDDVTFLGYRRMASGRDVFVGRYRGHHGSEEFVLGSPVDVVPRLPTFHGYRYAVVFPATDTTVHIPGWQQSYGSRASAFCFVLLFNTVTKDRYGDINMPVTGIVSAREGGVCVPENGVESLIQPTTMNLEFYLD